MNIWATWELVEGGALAHTDGHSGLYPSAATHQSARVWLGIIPGHCVPGHEDDEDAGPGPWLMLALSADHTTRYEGPMIADHATVVLDPVAARALGYALVEWTEGGHTRPREVAP